MHLDVSLAEPAAVEPLRDLHRREMNCQIVLDSWLGRRWVDPYLLRIDGRVVGYGLVGGVRGDPKDTVVEFFVLPGHRGAALPLFRRLVAVSRARGIEVQTNDVLLTLMLYDCATDIRAEAVLFAAGFATNLTVPGAVYRPATDAEKRSVFPHSSEPVGDWVIEAGGEIVATGGILFHYNVPFGDIYMEVAEPHRRRGYGSFLVQELKRTCHEMGRVPAARCNAANAASRATLQKAGMMPCARVLTGVLAVG
jgi:GNAT superfamily N-acetyltransferase